MFPFLDMNGITNKLEGTRIAQATYECIGNGTQALTSELQI